jgi:hypothetical protein
LPCNDDCENAFLITAGPIYTNSTIYASKDGPAIACEQSCGGQCNTAPDLWYRWVACNANQVLFSMCAITQDPTNYPASVFRYDAMMVIYDGCPIAGGTQITGGCNDDGCGGGSNSRITIAAGNITAGKTYWIRISGWSGKRGNFPLQIVQSGCQLNAAADPIPSNGATGVPSNQNLFWSAVAGATGYDVYLDAGLNPPVTRVSANQPGTAYGPGSLLSDTTYYWRIDTLNGVNLTTGSTWTFTTAP